MMSPLALRYFERTEWITVREEGREEMVRRPWAYSFCCEGEVRWDGGRGVGCRLWSGNLLFGVAFLGFGVLCLEEYR